MTSENNSIKQIKNGALISYVAIAISLLSGLFYTPWMVNRIGMSNYGLYTLATSLISMFLIDFGIGEAVSKFISKYNAEGNQEKVNNFLGLVYKLYIIIDAVIFMILLILYFFINNIFTELTLAEIEKFKVIYIISATFSIVSLPFLTLNGILESYEKFVSLKMCDLIHKLLLLFLMISAILMGYKLYALVLVNAFAGLVMIIIKFISVKRLTPIQVNFRFSDSKLVREIFGFSIWVTLISISQRFIFSITPSILGIVAGTKEIAVFGIAGTLEGYAYIISGAINGMFLPKISRIVTKSTESSNVLPIMIKVGRFQYAIIGLLLTGFTIIGKEFITLWMGNEYITAYYGAMIMILPGLFTFPQLIANVTIIVMNKVRLQSYVYIMAAVINIILSYSLSRFFGAFGASLSICIVYFIRFVAMNIIYYKVLHINIFSFFKESYLNMTPTMIITVVLGFVVNSFLSSNSWTLLVTKCIVIAMIYIILMWRLSLNNNEKSFVLKTFHKLV